MELILQQIIAKTIEIEKSAIGRLLEIDKAPILKAIDTIYNSSGTLIVTGVGKSAVVARKFVATLNSTGTPATFLHSSDALHGDMGIIREGDIVFIISKSGESSTLRMLVPRIISMGALIISISSKQESYLDKLAHHSVIVPCEMEADPNNLAPTASVIAHLVICDAIALGLQHLSGFTPYNFANIHPGGNLGKNLNLTAGEMATKQEAPKVGLETDLSGIIYEITNKRLGATAVLNGHDEIEGIITDGDLRRLFARKDFSSSVASDIMTKNPKQIQQNELASEAMRIMNEFSISQLIVINEENAYLGMIHLHDLIREGIVVKQ